MYILPLPELTLDPQFEELLRQNIWNMPDAAWTTTPSELTQWAPVLGTELEMFKNKFTLEAEHRIAEYRYFRIYPKTTVPPHKDKTRNSLIFFSLNPEIDHTLNFKNGRKGETIMSYRYSKVPTLVDVKAWHEAVNNSLEYRLAVIACFGYSNGTFNEVEELYKKKKLLCSQDQPNAKYRFPWENAND